MSSERTSEQSIAAAAAQWLARHDRGLRPEEQADFDVWLATDARHAAAYEHVRTAWDHSEKAKLSPELARMAQELDEQTRFKPLRASWPWRSTVALAAAACLAIAFGLWQRRAPSSPGRPAIAASYRVILPAVQHRVLEDGSVAELRGSDSAIETHFTPAERRVVLLKGEAFFEVAKNPQRPFVVEAGKISVRAVGTAFNVQLNSSEFAVVVTEGRVAVAHAAASNTSSTEAAEPVALTPTLAAGQRARLAREVAQEPPVLLKVDTLSSTELEETLAWQATWLVFDETPMTDAIDAFNRHGSRHFVVGDEALRVRKLTGTFRANNIEALLRLYELKVERRGDHEVLLAAEP